MVKKLVGTVVLSSFLATTGWAETPNPSVVMAPPSPSVIATPPQPSWSELNSRQKSILAPLSGEWDSLEYYRRKKWLGIVQRFPAMAPDEQRRIQTQMQEWSKLTPEQRRVARETFQTLKQMPPEKKLELKQKWEQYSSLPEEEKRKLKQEAASKAPPGHTPAPPRLQDRPAAGTPIPSSKP